MGEGRKLRLGYWLPSRKGMISVSYEQPGALLDEIKNEFINQLKTRADLVEFNDIRKSAIISGHAIYDGTPVENLDAFIWFGEIGKDARREHNAEILKSIERICPVINPVHGYELAMDKYLTSTILSKNGLNVPKFALVTKDNAEDVSNLVADWGSLLLKPRLGSYGIGIIKIDNPEDLSDYADYMPSGVHFIEQFIPNDPKDWIGINIIGGKHAYSYSKTSESFKGGWKVQDRASIGGKMVLAEPSELQLEIAVKVSKLLDMSWVGVDIITSKDGTPHVIDVNAFPGLYPEMFLQSRINGPEMMANAVFEKLGV
ncbi:MAG: ATP-grasp domain-containing protein [Candidatus Micrarchaeota archaeon]